jgi:hypothetical protein
VKSEDGKALTPETDVNGTDEAAMPVRFVIPSGEPTAVVVTVTAVLSTGKTQSATLHILRPRRMTK